MSKVVVFSKESGSNKVGGVKRLRGEAGKPGVEVKKYNSFQESATNQATLFSHDFVNNVYTSFSETSTNNYPFVLNWPTVGTAPSQRIGSRINLKAIRLKGWITLSPYQGAQIRWRLVLCRMNVPVGAALVLDAVTYLNQFINGDTTMPPEAFNPSVYSSWTRHNFYKKFKNVDNKDFKSKVIASGVLPATSELRKYSLHFGGTIGNNAVELNTISTVPNTSMPSRSENVGYLPLDVTVKINDNIDCDKNLRRYFLVFEADTGYGWHESGYPTASSPGMTLNCYCRTYFTDL